MYTHQYLSAFDNITEASMNISHSSLAATVCQERPAQSKDKAVQVNIPPSSSEPHPQNCSCSQEFKKQMHSKIETGWTNFMKNISATASNTKVTELK